MLQLEVRTTASLKCNPQSLCKPNPQTPLPRLSVFFFLPFEKEKSIISVVHPYLFPASLMLGLSRWSTTLLMNLSECNVIVL
jgi:hypothetical protein